MMRAKKVLISLAGFSALALAQNGDWATVAAKPVSQTVNLPAEIWPYLTVSLHAKVPGYVNRRADRRSRIEGAVG